MNEEGMDEEKRENRSSQWTFGFTPHGSLVLRQRKLYFSDPISIRLFRVLPLSGYGSLKRHHGTHIHLLGNVENQGSDGYILSSNPHTLED